MSDFVCKRCGKCCSIYNPFNKGNREPCPQLKIEDGLATCLIYDQERHDICKTYPDPNKGEKCVLEQI